MKRVILLLIVLFAIENHSFAQCEEQIVTLLTQADVDNFSTNYPECTIVKNLVIEGYSISNLNGLSQLTAINGKLSISSGENPEYELYYPLTDISGLNNITTVLKSVTLNNAPNISTVDVLNGLTQVGGSVRITGLTPLNITGFNNLLTVTGIITISSLNASSLMGFGSLTKCFDLQIRNNPNLQQVGEFVNLNQTDMIDIRDNPMLLTLPVLPAHIDYLDNLRISSNPLLENLQNLEVFKTIGSISIISMDGLVSLEGLENLEQITKGLSIMDCPLLSDLEALSNVTSFNSDPTIIAIQSNTSLSDISALGNIDTSTVSTFIIQNNPNLSDCSIANFCEKIELEGGDAFSQTANNAPGCNSAQEIADNCPGLGVLETAIQKHFLFPNPSDSTLNIRMDEPINFIQITDISGRTTNVKYFDDNILDISNLASGVYFIEVSTIKGFLREKFIKK